MTRVEDTVCPITWMEPTLHHICWRPYVLKPFPSITSSSALPVSALCKTPFTSSSPANCKLYGCDWACVGRVCAADIDRYNIESVLSDTAEISHFNNADETKAASTASLPLLQ